MVHIIQRLREEHANIARLLDAFDQQIAVFIAGGTPDNDVMTAALDYLESYAERFRHPKEDLVYSRLRQRDPDAAARVGDLIDGQSNSPHSPAASPVP